MGESTGVPTTGNTPPAKTSVWEDFIDIFYAPSQVFARRINGSAFIPIAVVTLLLVVLYYASKGVMSPIFEGEYRRGAEAAMRKNARITPEMMEKGKAMAQTFGGLFLLVITPVVILLTGVVTWLVGKLFDSEQTIRSAIVVAAYANIVRVVGFIVATIQATVMDPAGLNSQYSVSLSLARFVDPDTTAMPTLVALGRVDLFTIWLTALLVIGLIVTGRVPRGKAIVAGVIIFLVGGLYPLVMALRAA
ncbi:MAG: YIP1 family protein [Gemmatimonadota bacterium]|nr:YIP1 family protein [Gemmatimonadota bacterium]